MELQPVIQRTGLVSESLFAESLYLTRGDFPLRLRHYGGAGGLKMRRGQGGSSFRERQDLAVYQGLRELTLI